MDATEVKTEVVADLRTVTLKMRSDEISAIDVVKALMQRTTQDAISRSDVVRSALGRVLPEIKAELESVA